MRQRWSIGLVGLLLFLCGACSRGAEHRRGEIVFAVEKMPQLLDPRLATDAVSTKICRLIYSPVLSTNDQLQPLPHLAAAVENPDEKTYLITLRQGVKFHDGVELTAEDVAYTYRSILDPALASPYRSALEMVQAIEVLDRYRLRLTLKAPFSPFPISLTQGIVPKHLAEKKGADLSRQPLGSGPFRFDSRGGEDRLRLSRFDGYFKGPAQAPSLLFKAVAEDTVRIFEVQSGNAHLLQNDFPPSLLPRLQGQPSLAIASSPGVNYAYIGFNLRDPLLRKKEVRQAIAYAIDRQSIIRHKLFGTVTPASGLLSPAFAVYNPKVRLYPFDLARARKLLDQAGFPGGGAKPRFALEYKTSTNPLRLEIAKVVAEDLKKVGIEVRLRSLEWGVFYDDIKKGNFQMYSLAWTGTTTADQYFYALHSSMIPPAGQNRGHYQNPRFDRLLEEGRATLDLSRQKQIYGEIQKIAAEELPYVSLWWENNTVIASKRLQGYRPVPTADYIHLFDASLLPQ